MQGRPHTDNRMQNMRQGLTLIPVMQVPAFTIVVGQAGIGARGGHVGVE